MISIDDIKNFDIKKFDIKSFDIKKFDIRNIDLPQLDLTGLDLSRLDVRNAELPKFDLAKFDVPGFDMDRMMGFVRDAAYVGIGAAVVTAQKTAERRRAITDDVTAQVRKLVDVIS